MCLVLHGMGDAPLRMHRYMSAAGCAAEDAPLGYMCAAGCAAKDAPLDYMSATGCAAGDAPLGNMCAAGCAAGDAPLGSMYVPQDAPLRMHRWAVCMCRGMRR